MSRNSADSSIPPAIAGILQNLSSRPNVESTLVLSRGNGSIICATGNLSKNRRNSMVGRSGSAGLGTEATTTDPNPTEDTDGQETGSEVDGAATQNKLVMSAAETLALSVFGFVHSATMLGRAVGRSHSDPDSQDTARASLFETSTTQTRNDQHEIEDDESTGREDQVQLLRMRTKRQEIIIYPDSKYLCCVVQSVGKQVNGTT